MNTASALAQLHNFTQRIVPLQPQEWEAFSSIWSTMEAGRKTLLTKAGDTERYLYFVVEGIQRIYYSKPDGKEATLVFSYAPSFAGVIDSLLLQQPSRYYMETLTQSRFLRAHVQQWQQMVATHSGIAALSHKALLLAMSGIMERMTELQCFTAEEKFRHLLQRSPHVLQLIPHKYLANYLSIDASTFSKLLGTVRI